MRHIGVKNGSNVRLSFPPDIWKFSQNISSLIARKSIDQVLETASIEDVVGQFVSLKKRGVNMLGLCPFHSEKSPSFTVSPHKGFYKCFGCGKAGNSIGFIMEHEKLEFPDAVRWIAQRFNIPLEETAQTAENLQLKDERESLFVANAFAAEYFEKFLYTNPQGRTEGLAYLMERGLSEATLKAWNVGMAPGGRTTLLEAALKASFLEPKIIAAGLAIKPEDGKPAYDRFRTRIMFPIHNLSGKVVGFGGRVIGKGRENEPKYLNSPETEVYKKSQILYGLFQSRKSIRERDECIVTEGYLDVISFHAAGVTNAVGSAGTSLTEEHIKAIRRLTENVTLIYDRDKAGEKATRRAIELACAGGLNAYVVELPEGEDPDSFARKHSDSEVAAFLKDTKIDFYGYLRKKLLLDAGADPIQAAEATGVLLDHIALLPDPLKRGFYAQRIATDAKLDEGTVIMELNKRLLKRQQRTQSSGSTYDEAYEGGGPAIAPKPDLPVVNLQHNDYDQERDLIRNLVFYANLALNEEEQVGDVLVNECADYGWLNAEFDHLFYRYAHAKAGGKPYPPPEELISGEDPKVSALVIDLGWTMEESRLSTNWETMHSIEVPLPKDLYREDVRSAALRLKLSKIIRMMDDNLAAIGEETDERKLEEAMVAHQTLLDMRLQIAKDLGADILR